MLVKIVVTYLILTGRKFCCRSLHPVLNNGGFIGWIGFAISSFAQPKEGSRQNLQTIPVAELAKSFVTYQLLSPKVLAASS